MQRWMDDQDTFQGTQPGYWYDDGQPEPTYGTQADVEAAIEAVRQQEASQPAPSAPAAPSAPSVSYNAGLEDLSGANYSPETVAYLNNLDNQRQALMAKYGAGITLNNPEFMSSRYVQQPASDGYDKVYSSEEDIRRMMGQDASSIYNPGYDVQSWGGSRSPTVFDMVRLGADQTYNYTDNNTGQTYTASTPEQVQALTQLAKSQSGAGNNSASWSIKDSSGKEVASDTSYTPSFLKQTGQTISDLLVEYGPSILAIPMTGGMSLGALMATAGGTAAVGKLLKTGDLQKSLISGLTSAATAGALKVSGASDFIGNKLGEYGISMPTGASTAPSFAGPSSAAFSGVDLSSTLPGFAAGTSFGGAIAPPSGASEAIQVGLTKGATVPVASGVGSLVGNVAGNALPQGPGSYTNKAGVEEVNPTGTKPTNTGVGVAPVVASAITPAVTNTGTYIDAQGVERGTVTDTKPTNTGVDVAPVVTSAVDPYDTGEQLGYDNKPADPAKEKPFVKKVLPYVKPALIAAGLIANTVGSTKGTKPPGTGPTGTYVPDPLPKIFTDPLPGVVKPTELPKPYGATDPGAGGRNLTDEDWYSYGFGPEKSFFTDVPGTPIGVREPAPKLPVVPDPNLAVIPKPKLPVVPDPKLAVTPNPKLPVVPDPKLAVTPSKGLVKPETLLEARLKEMGTWVNDKTGNKYLAKGGSTNRFAVRGPGDGRSDDIPANLSDGEYVIDAETVALLGDGSSKAGADKLDRFRVNVRKHKGKSLAAGRFSVAAKQPEAYLKGRT